MSSRKSSPFPKIHPIHTRNETETEGLHRLVPIWAATLAVLQKSRTIRFNSPSQVLDYFELPKNGYHYKRIVHGFERIFGATIFFGTEDQREKDIISNWARFHFFDKMQL